jgi:phenylacetate-CoA ligase
VRSDQVLPAYRDFFAGKRRELDLVGFFHDVASVPAYRAFLAAAGVDPAGVRAVEDFHRLPMSTKDNYHRRYPLPQLCREGRLDNCDIVAVSSGSSGTPTV